MFPYDTALLATDRPLPNLSQTFSKPSRASAALCIDGDGLKWFNWVYLQVTQAVEARVAGGGFTDPTWLAQLDVQFARLYFTALKSSLCGQPTSPCWQVLFTGRNQGAIARIQFALAGMNAHINHDLPEAFVTTSQVTGEPYLSIA